jgi:hypothetical protein
MDHRVDLNLDHDQATGCRLQGRLTGEPSRTARVPPVHRPKSTYLQYLGPRKGRFRPRTFELVDY